MVQLRQMLTSSDDVQFKLNWLEHISNAKNIRLSLKGYEVTASMETSNEIPVVKIRHLNNNNSNNRQKIETLFKEPVYDNKGYV